MGLFGLNTTAISHLCEGPRNCCWEGHAGSLHRMLSVPLEKPKPIGGFNRFLEIYGWAVLWCVVCGGVSGIIVGGSLGAGVVMMIGGALVGGVFGFALGIPVALLIYKKAFRLSKWMVFIPTLLATAWVSFDLRIGASMPILAITICAGVAIAASAIVKLCLPDVWVLPDWVCQQCHFDLRGCDGDRCPECGAGTGNPAAEGGRK